MSILDDAIREHLELKRAHGADDAELKKLEDEAFGPPARPDDAQDPLAEAPTEFLAEPEIGADEAAEEARRRPSNVADLQEAPEPSSSQEPAEEEQPVMEHETAPEPEGAGDAGHSTEERHAIAEQPTELFDVPGDLDDLSGEAEAPSEEQLVDAELAEPRLAPVDPLAGIDGGAEAELDAGEEDGEEAEEDEDDFFSEQRLSDELNQALETPLPGEPQVPSTEEAEAIVEAPEEDAPEEEDSAEYEEEESGEFAAEGEHGEDDGDLDEDEEPQEERTEVHPASERGQRQDTEDDLLEHTPDFLEDAPEDDNLWFEQKPPKDFDFDD